MYVDFNEKVYATLLGHEAIDLELYVPHGSGSRRLRKEISFTALLGVVFDGVFDEISFDLHAQSGKGTRIVSFPVRTSIVYDLATAIRDGLDSEDRRHRVWHVLHPDHGTPCSGCRETTLREATERQAALRERVRKDIGVAIDRHNRNHDVHNRDLLSDAIADLIASRTKTWSES